MSPAHGEPGAFLPTPPGDVPDVPASVAGLAVAAPATDGPFIVEGRSAWVRGAQRAAGGVTTFPDVGTVKVSPPPGGAAASVVLFPGLARRDFAGAAGVESIVVAPDLPLVVLRWSGAGRWSAPLTLEIALERRSVADLDGSSTTAEVERTDDSVCLHADDRGIAVYTWPSARRVEVERVGSSGVRVIIEPADDAPAALVIAGGDRAAVHGAFAAARHLPNHAQRAALGPLEAGLTLATGVDELDDGVAWACARLAGLAARRAPTASTGLLLRLGLAAQIVGDRATAEAVLSAARLGEGPEGALLAGRQASVFGDVRRAATIARAWAGAVPNSDDADFRRLAGAALADGLLHAATPDLIAALRSRMEPAGAGSGATRTGPSRAATEPGSGGTGRSLPVVGGRVTEPSPSESLAALLAGEPMAPSATSRDGIAATALGVRSAAAAFRIDPARGWSTWRATLAEGLAEGPDGPATWGDSDEDSVAVELMLTLAHGLLGLVPDAPAGRLRIAPRLPEHLMAFSVDGIAVGEVRVRMSYERSGSTHLYTLEPTAGGVPPWLIFEPAVTGKVAELRVDGSVAELDLRRVGGLTVAPLQVALDAPRRLEIRAY